MARNSRAVNDTAVYIYDRLSQPNNVEYALTGYLDNGVIKIYDVRTINDSLNAEPNLMFGQRVNVIFIWHSHVSRSANPQIQDENSGIKVIGSYANSGIKFYVSDDPPNFQSWSLLNN